MKSLKGNHWQLIIRLTVTRFFQQTISNAVNYNLMEFADEELSCQSAAVLRITCLDPTCLLGFVICNMQLHFCMNFVWIFLHVPVCTLYPWNRVSLILYFINPMFYNTLWTKKKNNNNKEKLSPGQAKISPRLFFHQKHKPERLQDHNGEQCVPKTAKQITKKKHAVLIQWINLLSITK